MGDVHHGVRLGVAGLVVFNMTGLLGDGVANFFRNLSGLGVALREVVDYAVGIWKLHSDFLTLLPMSALHWLVI